MTVYVQTAAEWTRIVDRLRPTLHVSSDRQWFVNGYGMTFVFNREEQR